MPAAHGLRLSRNTAAAIPVSTDCPAQAHEPVLNGFHEVPRSCTFYHLRLRQPVAEPLPLGIDNDSPRFEEDRHDIRSGKKQPRPTKSSNGKREVGYGTHSGACLRVHGARRKGRPSVCEYEVGFRSTSWMAWRFPVAGRDHSHAIQILFLSPIHGVTERPDRLTSLAWQLR